MSIAPRRREREYEVCQTKGSVRQVAQIDEKRKGDKERERSGNIRLHLTCPFLSHTKDDVRRLMLHAWTAGWMDPGGVVPFSKTINIGRGGAARVVTTNGMRTMRTKTTHAFTDIQGGKV